MLLKGLFVVAFVQIALAVDERAVYCPATAHASVQQNNLKHFTETVLIDGYIFNTSSWYSPPRENGTTIIRYHIDQNGLKYFMQGHYTKSMQTLQAGLQYYENTFKFKFVHTNNDPHITFTTQYDTQLLSNANWSQMRHYRCKINFNSRELTSYLVLHEIGHCIGIRTNTYYKNTLMNYKEHPGVSEEEYKIFSRFYGTMPVTRDVYTKHVDTPEYGTICFRDIDREGYCHVFYPQ